MITTRLKIQAACLTSFLPHIWLLEIPCPTGVRGITIYHSVSPQQSPSTTAESVPSESFFDLLARINRAFTTSG
ncbi:hypothetical protein F4859DRAFT_478347 [Xylaria cf. heliscus]|nr:hypothetical protein F4859DRAFT_478347 [Xylaria cf. heliscus]